MYIIFKDACRLRFVARFAKYVNNRTKFILIKKINVGYTIDFTIGPLVCFLCCWAGVFFST